MANIHAGEILLKLYEVDNLECFFLTNGKNIFPSRFKCVPYCKLLHGYISTHYNKL